MCVSNGQTKYHNVHAIILLHYFGVGAGTGVKSMGAGRWRGHCHGGGVGASHGSWRSREVILAPVQCSSLNPTRITPPCYNNTTLGNRLYAQRKGPNVTNPICWTCKNCSYECAADWEHCVTQPSTEQFW